MGGEAHPVLTAHSPSVPLSQDAIRHSARTPNYFEYGSEHHMNTTAAVLASLLLLGPQAAQPPKSQNAADRRLDKFVVALIEDVKVPAREPGVLVALNAKKGQVVRKDDVLGHIDDSDTQIRKLIADSELKAAQAQAASDANVKAAEKTIEVALAEYEGDLKIKERSENAVSEFEIRRTKLTHERSVFQAETARVEYEVAQHTLGKAAAQLQAVENEITRRLITSPVDGVVVDKYLHMGEWAQAGEPVYRIVQMDRLRVEGMLRAADYLPEEVAGNPVRIIVTTSEGHREEFEGTIEFVSPVVDPSGEFLIHADFDNPRKPNGQWRVRPGLDAEIVILPSRQAPVSAAETGRK
jgi:multidrug efflux pump subunit AcrA (membrane-fusion protein)